MKIAGSCAIVTGAGSGLGAATARMLSGLGARVIAFDRDGSASAKIANDIGGIAVEGDVTSEADAEKVTRLAAAEAGGLRILVNCAGIGTAGRMLSKSGTMPLTNFDRVIRVNLIGTFNMMRLAAACMAEASEHDDHGRGVIVNTASVAAFDGQIGQAAYAASKGGIVSLALPAARELARFGIRVNTIAPGIFLTPLLTTLPSEIQQNLASSIPYPSRPGDPAEFADAVRFAVENRYLNGEVIRLDGALRVPSR